MKYISEFRNNSIAQDFVQSIRKNLLNKNTIIKIMEVCGTHTMAIHKYGIKKLLPSNLKLLSGPGCPVCVTPDRYIDMAIAYSNLPNIIITTFGDMIKVPGSSSSLEIEKSKGADIRIVYSPIDALKIAQSNPDLKIIFLGVGFETTIPTVAGTILQGHETNIKNFYILPGFKVIPQTMKCLIENPLIQINGFICPGHVSTIIGIEPYYFISDVYKISCVISGFEPLDILQSIDLLVKQIVSNKPQIINQYNRVVSPSGNKKAQSIINKIFMPTDAEWRGLGIIKNSGLKFRPEFENFDITNHIKVKVSTSKKDNNCICGEILQGISTPDMCKLFAKKCTPDHPVGPCMVSHEGTCAALFKYKD